MNTFKLKTLVKSEESVLSQQISLSICLRTDGFSFSLIDNHFRLNAIGEFEVDLLGGITAVMTQVRECFASIGIRTFSFKEIRVICLTNKNVWVPFKLFDNTRVKDYLKAAVHVNTSETILYNISEKLEAASVFAFPMNQNTGVKILMPKAQFFNQHQIMAEYAYDISSLKGNTLILHKRKDACDMVVFKGSSFLYSNSFDYKNEADLLYFILFVMEQLFLGQDEVNCLLTGIDFTQEEKDIIRHHIKNVSYANAMENIKVGIDFDGINLQPYFLTLVR